MRILRNVLLLAIVSSFMFAGSLSTGFFSGFYVPDLTDISNVKGPLATMNYFDVVNYVSSIDIYVTSNMDSWHIEADSDTGQLTSNAGIPYVSADVALTLTGVAPSTYLALTVSTNPLAASKNVYSVSTFDTARKSLTFYTRVRPGQVSTLRNAYYGAWINLRVKSGI